MPLPDDLLNPIEGPNPSGVNLRYNPVYDKIKEARREEDQPPPGMTERDRKVADNAQVIKLTTDALTTKTKDLQLAAWLTEAWLKQKGFGGLKDGLSVCHGLVEKFWDSVYPEIEDGEVESRGAPLGFVGTKLEIPLKLVPVVEKAKYSFLDHQQSREVGYEDQAKTDEAKKKRNLAIKEGKLAPEVFDAAFEETPKRFYAQAEKDLDACLQTLTNLRKRVNRGSPMKGHRLVPCGRPWRRPAISFMVFSRRSVRRNRIPSSKLPFSPAPRVPWQARLRRVGKSASEF